MSYPFVERRAAYRIPLSELPLPHYEAASEPAEDPLADLKLFATGWLGGLVFFGTLFA